MLQNQLPLILLCYNLLKDEAMGDEYGGGVRFWFCLLAGLNLAATNRQRALGLELATRQTGNQQQYTAIHSDPTQRLIYVHQAPVSPPRRVR